MTNSSKLTVTRQWSGRLPSASHTGSPVNSPRKWRLPIGVVARMRFDHSGPTEPSKSFV
jgi:hypothetical protein